MDKSPKRDVGFLPAFLAGPWPVMLLLVSHFALGLSAAAQKSVTFDEITHLSSGYSYWATNDYRLDPESGNWPQRWAALPIWLEGYRFPALDDSPWQNADQWTVADRFFYSSGNDADFMLLQGRAMIGLLSVALGLLVYLWSRQLFGPISGLISLTLYAFSPTTLSHGFLATADLSTALFFTAAVWVLWSLLHRLSWFTLAASCLALAGLFLSKFSAVLVIPMGGLLILVRLLNPKPMVWALGRPRMLPGRLRQLAVISGLLLVQILIVALVIWASYGFRYSMFQGAGQRAEESASWMKNASEGLGITRSFVQLAQEHHALPEAYLFGFTFTILSSQQRQAFLNGDFSINGWTSYFPYALAVKTPLEVFLILILAAAGAWFWRRNSLGKDAASSALAWQRADLYDIAPLLILLAVYWLFSLTSHLNIGHRHLLPTYPAMFILAGAAAAWFQAPAARIATKSTAKSSTAGIAASSKRGRKWIVGARSLVIGSLLLAVAEALGSWPNYLAYFNVLAGGPQNGYKHLVDSSLDWGQDLKGLKHWLATHPEDANHVYLAYFGTASPQYYGIDATLLPGFFSRYQPHIPEPLVGGTYCISATLLQGVYVNFPGRWNTFFENLYQQCRQSVRAYRNAANDPDALKKLTAGASQMEIDKVFTLYENLRLARLCSFLRAREPDFDVGHSILIFRLNQADVQRATDGPPVELLPDCEPDVKACLGIR